MCLFANEAIERDKCDKNLFSTEMKYALNLAEKDTYEMRESRMIQIFNKNFFYDENIRAFDFEDMLSSRKDRLDIDRIN